MAAKSLPETAVALCGAARADVGVRMAAIKLVEQAALLYSGRGGAGLPDAAALMACAEALLRGLAQPLAPAGVRQQPGPDGKPSAATSYLHLVLPATLLLCVLRCNTTTTDTGKLLAMNA